jgi:hypothetical protein
MTTTTGTLTPTASMSTMHTHSVILILFINYKQYIIMQNPTKTARQKTQQKQVFLFFFEKN